MELKPCPFCGADVRLDKAYSYFRDSVIYCDGCDMVFTLDDTTATDDDIIKAWNRRGKKPFYRKKKWKNIYWDIPYCPHCNQELGLEDTLEKPEKCSECGRPLEWDDKENNE